MNATEPHRSARGPELLLEHVTAPDHDRQRRPARERLERILGGQLAQLLIGALSARRRRG